MVSSVSGNTSYSALAQILATNNAAVSAAPVTPAADTASTSTSSTSAAATASTANALGLPPEVVSLLQGVNNSGDSVVSELLGGGSSSNSVSNLLGVNIDDATSADNFLVSQDSDVLGAGASAGLYQAALDGASTKQDDTAVNTDYIDNVLGAYNSAMNQLRPQAPSIDTTG